MFETSKDVLNIVIASSVGVLTIFICIAIYYFARILEQGFKIIKEMRDRISKIDEFITLIKNKIESSSSYLVLIAEGMKKMIEVVKEKTSRKQED